MNVDAPDAAPRSLNLPGGVRVWGSVGPDGQAVQPPPNVPAGTAGYYDESGTPQLITGKGVNVTTNVGGGETEEAKELGKLRGKRAETIEAAAMKAPDQIAKLNLLQGVLERARTGTLAPTEAKVVGLAQSLGIPNETLAGLGLNPEQAVTSQIATKLTNELVTGMIGGGGFPSNNFSNSDREHEDLFRQFPGARDRLQAIASAHDGIETVMRSPLGKIANRPQVQEAIQALFPTGGKGVSAEEVGQAVAGMARNNARAAQDLVRMHVEQVFQDATQRLQSGANQAGGPKFSQGLVGHAGEGASVEAAIKALPGGEQTWTGIRRLLDIFDAQGSRQAIGSGTTYNNAIDADLRAGKPLSEAGAAVMTGGVKLPGRIMDRIEQWRMGSGLDELAQLFTDPKMGPTFRRLATQPPNSEGLVRLSIMALDRAMRGYGMAKRSDASADPEGQPLKLSVRPRP